MVIWWHLDSEYLQFICSIASGNSFEWVIIKSNKMMLNQIQLFIFCVYFASVTSNKDTKSSMFEIWIRELVIFWKFTKINRSHTNQCHSRCFYIFNSVVIKEAMQLLLKKADDELVQRLKDEQYISTYLTDEDDANYFATVTIPCFFGNY